uniref:Mannosyltransferase n=1 Tax=Palpitomonas bilix TaxID=652834 RepID=A0A7S3LW66_9EUKA|mmetsp:Transcript_5537/g.12740  ORF Transcript_5537/g.12740 Transcript_5537/m.12740 type:complete len:786 (+) Transcript_5537:148-2505(+)
MENTTLVPRYKWGQSNIEVRITFESGLLEFEHSFDGDSVVQVKGKGKEGQQYAYSFQLFAGIAVDRCRIENVRGAICLRLKKTEEEEWPCLQKKGTLVPKVEGIDWDMMATTESDDEFEKSKNFDPRVDMEVIKNTPSFMTDSNAADEDSKLRHSSEKVDEKIVEARKEGKTWKLSYLSGLRFLFRDLLCPLDEWDLILTFVICFYVTVCPFTKVEESFNVQAVHDLIYEGFNFSNYDHHQFPGVVPRTFIGALLLGILSFPFTAAVKFMLLPKTVNLMVVRVMLGAANLMAAARIRRELARRFEGNSGMFFILITCTQFHINFYSSRTLPNTFALVLMQFAFAFFIRRQYMWSIRTTVIAGALFRSELALYLAFFYLVLVVQRKIKVFYPIMQGALVFFACLCVSILVDSFLWRRWVWPEGEVFFFNTVLNKSHEWGVMAWHWYFSNALPKSLLLSLPLALISFVRNKEVRELMLPSLLFLIAYSFLPHKELRFVFYVIPVFNAAAALEVSHLWKTLRKRWLAIEREKTMRKLEEAYPDEDKQKKKEKRKGKGEENEEGKEEKTKAKKPLPHLISFFQPYNLINVGIGYFLCLCVSCIFLYASSYNYFGATAVSTAHRVIGEDTRGVDRQMLNEEGVTLHIDAAAATTGVSRFCESSVTFLSYSKEEDLNEEEYVKFEYLINENATVSGFDVVEVIDGYKAMRVNTLKLGIIVIPLPHVEEEPKLYVHRRADLAERWSQIRATNEEGEEKTGVKGGANVTSEAHHGDDVQREGGVNESDTNEEL